MSQPTCEDRIADQLAGRIADISALNDLASVYDTTRLAEVLEDRATRELFCELTTRELFGPDVKVPEPCYADDIAALDDLEELLEGFDIDSLRESAQERTYELPLGVSTRRVFRVELSTGGPADWLEVICTGDTPDYEGGEDVYEVERIVYHFADWFDHAERELDGFELEAAEAFAREVIPELTA